MLKTLKIIKKILIKEAMDVVFLRQTAMFKFLLLSNIARNSLSRNSMT